MSSRWSVRLGVVLVSLAAASSIVAQEGASDVGTRLLADPAVRAALDAAKAGEPQLLHDQARICAIPAPPFGEGERAKELRRSSPSSVCAACGSTRRAT